MANALIIRPWLFIKYLAVYLAAFSFLSDNNSQK